MRAVPDPEFGLPRYALTPITGPPRSCRGCRHKMTGQHVIFSTPDLGCVLVLCLAARCGCTQPVGVTLPTKQETHDGA